MNSPSERISIVRKKILNKPRKYFLKYGIAETTLRNWESGYNKKISDKNIALIVHAFNSEDIQCDAQWIKIGKGVSPFSVSLFDLVKKQNDNYDIDQIEKNNKDSKSFSINSNKLEPFVTYGDIVIGNEEQISKLENLYAVIAEGSVFIGFCRKISLTQCAIRYLNTSYVDIFNISNIYSA